MLDFGLVKPVASAPSELSLGTAAGLTPGTPAYMPPEAALGEAVDGRSDLYALGCVAYYLVTGLPVFEATTSVQMIAKHMTSTPVPPSERARRPLPAALDQLILACLAKQPAGRPESAAELSRLLATVEVEPWSDARAIEWWQANGSPISARPGAP